MRRIGGLGLRIVRLSGRFLARVAILNIDAGYCGLEGVWCISSPLGQGLSWIGILVDIDDLNLIIAMNHPKLYTIVIVYTTFKQFLIIQAASHVPFNSSLPSFTKALPSRS